MAKAPERKDNFVFYEDWVDAMNTFGLSDAQFRAVVCAAVEYNRSGHAPTDEELDPVCRMMFATMRTKMDKNASKYAQKREQSSQAGKASAEKRAEARNESRQSQQTNPTATREADANEIGCSEQALTDATDVDGRNEINESNRKEGIGKDGLGRDRFGEDTPKPPEGAEADQALPGKPKGKPVLTTAQRERFDRWYAAYPRKTAKDAAMRAWAKINPDDELTEVMIRAVQDQIQRDDRFREQRFIPYPAKWLNGGEWQNEYSDAPQPRARNDDPYTDWSEDIAAVKRLTGD